MKSSLENLAKFLNIPPKELGAIIFRTDLYYEEINVAKKRGGFRTLNIPNNTLKGIQRIIYRNLLKNLEVHVSAQAYVQKRSIITNATKHLNSVYMLKMDIEDFFGSIREELVREKFMQMVESIEKKREYNEHLDVPNFTENDCRCLAKICTLNGGLPQGAVTSPHLSNLIFFEIDETIKLKCEEMDIIYTRYSDDMIFTGATDKVFEIEEFVREKIRSINLSVNQKKTVRLYDRHVKYVTGLCIQNGKVRLSKSRRREIRQQYH